MPASHPKHISPEVKALDFLLSKDGSESHLSNIVRNLKSLHVSYQILGSVKSYFMSTIQYYIS